MVLAQGWLALQMHDTIMIKRILANYSSNEPSREWAQLLASLSIHQKAFNSAYFYLRQLAISNPRFNYFSKFSRCYEPVRLLR